MNTMDAASVDAAAVDGLRVKMVSDLRALGAVSTEAVAEALLRVPRHLFAPAGEPLERVYAATTAIVTKRNEHGAATSSLSESHIQAAMLEQAEIEPGMRVLEIGTGGYNAALIAELVGDHGQVTSVDIDPDIVANARACLHAADYDHVTVIEADAEHGVPDAAPYDRIIVTAGAWDIPPAWISQLTDAGRIVVPLRMRGLTRSVAFDRDGDRLVSRSYRLCGFVPMQGDSAHTERLFRLKGDDVFLTIDTDDINDANDANDVNDAGDLIVDRDGQMAALAQALVSPRTERWSGVTFDQVDHLDFFMGTATPGFGILRAADGPITDGLVGASTRRGVPTLLREGNLAYRTKRPVPGSDDFETGVIAHGPQADALARDFLDLVGIWDRDYRHGGATITVHPAATPDEDLPSGLIIDKRHTRIVVTWP